jgi:GNAT superfamily N-acetyltransferase
VDPARRSRLPAHPAERRARPCRGRPDARPLQGALAGDGAHTRFCTEVGLLVEDRWQGLGIGAELIGHLAGVAQVASFHALIAYPATALGAVQRLMVSVGHTRRVADTELHLHTYLPDSAALGIGSIRQRLAG